MLNHVHARVCVGNSVLGATRTQSAVKYTSTRTSNQNMEEPAGATILNPNRNGTEIITYSSMGTCTMSQTVRKREPGSSTQLVG